MNCLCQVLKRSWRRLWHIIPGPGISFGWKSFIKINTWRFTTKQLHFLVNIFKSWNRGKRSWNTCLNVTIFYLSCIFYVLCFYNNLFYSPQSCSENHFMWDHPLFNYHHHHHHDHQHLQTGEFGQMPTRHVRCPTDPCFKRFAPCQRKKRHSLQCNLKEGIDEEGLSCPGKG